MSNQSDREETKGNERVLNRRYSASIFKSGISVLRMTGNGMDPAVLLPHPTA